MARPRSGGDRVNALLQPLPPGANELLRALQHLGGRGLKMLVDALGDAHRLHLPGGRILAHAGGGGRSMTYVTRISLYYSHLHNILHDCIQHIHAESQLDVLGCN